MWPFNPDVVTIPASQVAQVVVQNATQVPQSDLTYLLGLIPALTIAVLIAAFIMAILNLSGIFGD